MSTLYISHGDKGGVGKSMVSIALIEWLLHAGCKRLALVEGDPSQPDLEKRYAEVDQILTGYLPLNRPGKAAGDAVTALATWIEKNSPDAVVVNLPGGAGETLDGLGGVIRAVCDVLGMRMVALYSLGVTDALTAGMVGSLSDGLLSHVDPDNRAAVYPLFSAPRSAFLWSRSDQRKIYLMHDIEMPDWPALGTMLKMLNTPGSLATLAQTGAPGWMIVDLINTKHWLDKALSALNPIMTIGA